MNVVSAHTRKIVVNCRFLRLGKMDGIGWVTYHTIKYLVQQNPDIHFYLLFDSEIGDEFIFGKNVTPIKLYPPAKHALLNIIWFEYSVKRVLNKIKPDLFISPDGILCLTWNGPQHGIIHDINFVHIPEDLKFSNRAYFNYIFPRSARKAKRIATVSQYSKEDIAKNFSIPHDKIDVILCGINAGFQPLNEQDKKLVREKYTDGKPYFIFVGTLHPRKNIYRLMEAFESFKTSITNDTKLVLCGWEMFRTEELHELHNKMKWKEDVIFTGRLPDSEVKNLVGAALCMSFVPYFEGFGIPPLEAMAANVPVIASNVTSIPEVVGDAGISVDPYDVDEIANAMKQIYTDALLRQELIARGVERAKMFTWEKTAKLFSDSVFKCLDQV